MLTELSDQLLDLTATEKGYGRALYAMGDDGGGGGGGCSCSGCIIFCCFLCHICW